jgi:hypothetical protein
MLAQGVPNKEIADRLHLAEGTIKNHVSNILDKLQVHNRTQAADLARPPRSHLTRERGGLRPRVGRLVRPAGGCARQDGAPGGRALPEQLLTAANGYDRKPGNRLAQAESHAKSYWRECWFEFRPN